MDLHDALTVARAALAGRNGPDDRRAHETICTFVQLIPREVLFAKVALEPRPKMAIEAAWQALRSVVGEENVSLADAANRALGVLREHTSEDRPSFPEEVRRLERTRAAIKALDIALGNINPWTVQKEDSDG